MKIMQVITRSILGGAQSVVINLANQLVEKGHEVIVVAGPEDGKMWNILAPAVTKVECSLLQRAVSPLVDLKTIIALRKIYHQYTPDVIHLHSSKAGLLGRLAFPKGKIIYTVHGFDSIRLSYKIFLPLERLMQNRCSSIVGVSNYDVRMMASCKITKNVSYVYNGIDKASYDSSLSWIVPNGKFKKVILCIARVAPPKRDDLFIELAAKHPDYAFVWIGNLHEVKVPYANVFFLGNVERGGRFCQLADLFVLPSDFEGLPMVILEAMSYGLPVVASNVGGVSEIVQNGINGFSVNNTVDDFSKAISTILEDNDLYSSMKMNSLNRFERDLTSEEMLQGYLKIYKRIASC